MRYFVTLPFAALAFAATPAMAQDTATPPGTATTQTPPSDPMAQPAATPPSDPMAPAPTGTTTTPPPTEPTAPTGSTAPTPAETVESAPPAGPTPGSPPTGMTPEQQVAHDAWPAEMKAYFGALTPTRQQLFLRITDNDKAKLVALPAAQQETVWASLERQAAAESPASPTDTN